MHTMNKCADEERDHLRFELMRRDLKLYEVAPRVGCHPSALGRMLRGRIPLPPEIATRLRDVLAGEAAS
jgi:plasmid maintenance system antidote protein VapI